jgi:hypothetical protein
MDLGGKARRLSRMVRAQAGKSIDHEQAQLLITISQTL